MEALLYFFLPKGKQKKFLNSWYKALAVIGLGLALVWHFLINFAPMTYISIALVILCALGAYYTREVKTKR